MTNKNYVTLLFAVVSSAVRFNQAKKNHSFRLWVAVAIGMEEHLAAEPQLVNMHRQSHQSICLQRSAYILAIVGIFVGVAVTVFAAEERPKVQIPQGILEGNAKVSRNGRAYSEFLGIPYGKSERFEDSELGDGWSGTRDASKFGENCIQKNFFNSNDKKTYHGSEDCLFLNIFTPKLSNESNLPSMVFIHGGGFQFWSGAISHGKYFMDQDVILVTINYRLGVFGFANTGQGTNFGLKDQVLALKWVQQNIKQFGGNPNSVTIFGESAGALSVHYHILSPLSKGLFHRAISQSGTANCPFGSGLNSAREFKKLGILMDCPTSNPEFLIKCLKRIDAGVLLSPLPNSPIADPSGSDDAPQFNPTVDKNSKSGNVFLPDTPLNLMRGGDFAKVPWISGLNTLEGLFFPGSPALMNQSRESWDWKDAKALVFDEHDCKGLEKIRQFYAATATKSAAALNENITSLFSDRYFVFPAKVAAVLHAKFAPTFLYHFSYRSASGFLGDLNPTEADGLKRQGHADELQFLFDFDDVTKNVFPEITAESKTVGFSNYLVRLWTSFAKDGETALETLSSKVTPTASWTRVSDKIGVGDDVEWFEIDNDSKMVTESKLFGSRLKFWNDLVGEGEELSI